MVDFSPTLLRAAYLLLRDKDAAEDAVQSTLLRTFRRWAQAKASPEAYSQRVLVNVCRDHWRHRRRHPEEAQPNASEALAPVIPLSGLVEQLPALEAALHDLPTQQREVLVLRFFLDLSVARTAELLGIAEGTVKSSTHRGLNQLRELVSTQPEEVRHGER